MRKMFLTVVILACMSAMLFATATTEQQASKPNELTEIKVWTRLGGSREFEIKEIENWNNTRGKEHGIKVVPEFFGEDYDDVMAFARDSGNMPDLFHSRGNVSNWVASGKVMPYDELPGCETLIAQYRSAIVPGNHEIGGRVYSIPNIANTFRLVVNKTLLEQSGFTTMPKDWDELRSMARKVTVDNKGRKFGLAIPLKFGTNGVNFWKLGAMFSIANTTGVWSWYNPAHDAYEFSALEPVLQLMRDIKGDKSFLPGAEGLDNDTARAEFAAGNIAFMYAASWDYGVYTTQFPIGSKFDWDFIEFPGSHEYSTPLSAGIRVVDCISADTKVPLDKIAFFLKDFAFGEDLLLKGYEQGLYLPVLPSITGRSTADLKKQWVSLAPTVRDMPEFATPDPFVAFDGKSWPEVFMDIWSNDSMDISAALVDLDVRYNKGLADSIANGTLDMANF